MNFFHSSIIFTIFNIFSNGSRKKYSLLRNKTYFSSKTFLTHFSYIYTIH